jgi:hypothetical protein
LDSLQQKSAVLAITMVAALALLMLLSYLFKVNEAKTLVGLITRKRRQTTD